MIRWWTRFLASVTDDAGDGIVLLYGWGRFLAPNRIVVEDRMSLFLQNTEARNSVMLPCTVFMHSAGEHFVAAHFSRSPLHLILVGTEKFFVEVLAER